MARVLAVFALCLCLAVAFAADLRSLNAQRAAQVAPPASRAGADGKASGDLDTASSWGWGGWGGPGFYGGGGPWGWGPWGYGYGYGYGFPFPGGWW